MANHVSNDTYGDALKRTAPKAPKEHIADITIPRTPQEKREAKKWEAHHAMVDEHPYTKEMEKFYPREVHGDW